MSTQALYQTFLSHFKRGMMRPNKFLIRFTLPAGVSGSEPFIDSRVKSGVIQAQETMMNGLGSINIKCHTANFPQRNLITSERTQNSSAFRVPYTQTYDPVTFSFYADGNADTRRYFDLWQNAVINVRSNTLNFYNEFTSNIEIWNLNEADQMTYGVRLEEAFPMSIGAMDISYGNSGTFQTVVCTFQYRRWVEIGSRADYQRAANDSLGGNSDWRNDVIIQ